MTAKPTKRSMGSIALLGGGRMGPNRARGASTVTSCTWRSPTKWLIVPNRGGVRAS